MIDVLQRLRERKLAQWALAYLAGAWVLLQVLGMIGQQFDWPPGLLRGFTVAAGVGFFVVLVLAWYHGERGAQRVSGTELLIIALLLVIGGGLLWRFAPRASVADGPAANAATSRAAATSATPPASDKSIAVLPFQNLSDDKANAYFADGIQDEILTKLAKIGALRVVSRTTTKRFAGTTESLAEVARQLGVANILEGSVQKAGNSVHINVQLIGAAKDEHIWAESYNRTLDDVFGVQGEVAQAVAEALNAKLTGAERQVVASTGTDNPKAFEAYLKGRAANNSAQSYSSESLATDHYFEATREDPKFAQAWAAAAVAMSDLYFNGVDRERSTAEAVKHAADTAMALQPDLAESLLARGAWLYRVARDYPRAADTMKQALAKQPGDVDILSNLFFIERRLGRWEDAIGHYRETMARDPRNVPLRVQGAYEILGWLRRYDEVRERLQQALKIAPDDTSALSCLALVEQRLGRLDAAAQWLARVPKDSRDDYEALAWMDQLVYRRDYPGLSEFTAAAARRADAELSYADWLALIRLGHAQRASGHVELAQATFQRLARVLDSRPGSVEVFASTEPIIPLVYAGLGDYERAFAAARRQIEGNRNDTLGLARAKTALAQIHAQKGERDAAIALLPELLEMPAGITPAQLALDPLWDPIRDDPRFVALTRKPLAVYKAPPRE